MLLIGTETVYILFLVLVLLASFIFQDICPFHFICGISSCRVTITILTPVGSAAISFLVSDLSGHCF